MDLYISVHNLEIFSSNPGKVHLEGLVRLLRYIRDNKNFIFRYYSKIEDAPISDFLRQVRIKTDNILIVFSDSSCQDCPYNDRSTGEYIVFYQGGPIDNFTHGPGLVAPSSAESEYNAACKLGMALAQFRMINNDFEQ